MTDDEKSWGRDFVAKAICGKSVSGLMVVHLGAAGSGKRWPGGNARNIIALAVKNGYHCFLFDNCEITCVGGVYPPGTTLTKNLTNTQTISIIYACDVVLCVDNYIFNIGKSAKKAVVPLFGFVPDYYAKVGDGRSLLLRSPSNYTPDPDVIFEQIDKEKRYLSNETALAYDLGEIKTFEI